MPLVTNGNFYPTFVADRNRYTDDDRACIESVVEALSDTRTSADRPGMLLGKIQSGKTKTFLASVALAFDNGFDIAIVLTKGTKALLKQTLQRVRSDFSSFDDRDQLQVFDIMTLPEHLTGYELNQKLIFVVKKQVDNLNRVITLFRETYPQLSQRRVVIVDDEADYASIGFRRTREEGIVINRTTRQIDTLRQIIPASTFLQVTATPYSLYLQPENLEINGEEFRPVRPAFTELVPIHPNYIGSDYYFDREPGQQTIASFLYQPVSLEELTVLRQEDRRRFRIEECLTSTAITALRSAIANFIVGGVVRRLQDEHGNVPPKRFGFLIHTESQRAAHAWQERVVTQINDNLMAAAEHNPAQLRALFAVAFADLANSVQILNSYLPPENEVIDAAITAIRNGWLMITKVNSERQVEELLDEQGQLRLRTPLNIFIGGQILDRGITISNLIGFYYGRRPQVYQQDTVLQHSRMFGFRPIEDLAVTRFYTERAIYDAMRRMHESDVALREAIERDPDNSVVFIRSDDRGQIVPCSPNKILISNTTTLRPFKRILPVGFQTDYQVRMVPIVRGIDQLVDEIAPDGNIENPFEIDLQVGLNLLDRIEPTLLMDEAQGYRFDWDAAKAALRFMSRPVGDGNMRRIFCLVRRNRNISRTIAGGIGRTAYSDAPDTRRTEGNVIRAVATNMPVLVLLKQNGLEEQGWRGTPFYWPIIYAQGNIRTSIFAHETTP